MAGCMRKKYVACANMKEWLAAYMGSSQGNELFLDFSFFNLTYDF